MSISAKFKKNIYKVYRFRLLGKLDPVSGINNKFLDIFAIL